MGWVRGCAGGGMAVADGVIRCLWYGGYLRRVRGEYGVAVCCWKNQGVLGCGVSILRALGRDKCGAKGLQGRGLLKRGTVRSLEGGRVVKVVTLSGVYSLLSVRPNGVVGCMRSRRGWGRWGWYGGMLAVRCGEYVVVLRWTVERDGEGKRGDVG